jgi:hypothetical protein
MPGTLGVLPRATPMLEQAQSDPNWFPSSLAQSAAGVVGVLSAVLITQLQQWLTRAEDEQKSGGLAIQAFVQLLAQDLGPLRTYLEHAAA